MEGNLTLREVRSLVNWPIRIAPGGKGAKQGSHRNAATSTLVSVDDHGVCTVRMTERGIPLKVPYTSILLWKSGILKRSELYKRQIPDDVKALMNRQTNDKSRDRSKARLTKPAHAPNKSMRDLLGPETITRTHAATAMLEQSAGSIDAITLDEFANIPEEAIVKIHDNAIEVDADDQRKIDAAHAAKVERLTASLQGTSDDANNIALWAAEMSEMRADMPPAEADVTDAREMLEGLVIVLADKRDRLKELATLIATRVDALRDGPDSA